MSGTSPILSKAKLEELAEQAQRLLDKEDDILELQTMLRKTSKEELVKYLLDHPKMLPPLEEAINDDFAKNQVTKAAKEAAIQARNIIRKQTTSLRANERRAAILSLQHTARNATTTKRREGEGRKLYKTMNRKARKSRKARKARKARKSRKSRKN